MFTHHGFFNSDKTKARLILATQSTPLRHAFILTTLCAALALTGCGGGGGGGGSAGQGANGGSGIGVSSPSLLLTMTNQSGLSTNSLKNGEEATLTFRALDAAGNPISNRIIEITMSDSALGTLEAGKVLTDSRGLATTRLTASSQSGAGTLTATMANGSSTINSNAFNFSVSSQQFNLSPVQLGVPSITTGGTVAASVTLTDTAGNALDVPVDVTFTSNCASNNKALLDSASSANVKSQNILVNGVKQSVASVTYTDKGCSGVDKITATAKLGTVVKSSATNPDLTITSVAEVPTSLEFVSATPKSIKLQSLGGSVSSTLSFKLKDRFGNPVANTKVSFQLNSTAGGTSLQPYSSQSAVGTLSGTTDNNGQANVTVYAGNVSTVVRVTASVASGNTTIQTQSSDLTISTGIPHHSGFSLGASKLNPEFLNYNGESIDLSVYASDRFGNPVPDGTPISFRTESGVGLITPSCTTTNGSCAVKLTSGGDRRALVGAGQQTIMAFTDGEESFSDTNGNGVWDQGEPFVDLPEMFLPADGRDYKSSSPTAQTRVDGAAAAEEFVDYNRNNRWDGKDGTYNGVLRSSSVSSAIPKSLTIGDIITIVWSGSYAGQTVIDAPALCTNGSRTSRIDVIPRDDNGNTMPEGTTVAVSVSPALRIIGNSSARIASQTQPGIYSFTVGIANDAAVCPVSGTVDITITTPKGIVTTRQVSL